MDTCSPYDNRECIIPNYRLRKNDLEIYLGRIFPSLWVQARVGPRSCPVALPSIAARHSRNDQLDPGFNTKIWAFLGGRRLLCRQLASLAQHGMCVIIYSFWPFPLPIQTPFHSRPRCCVGATLKPDAGGEKQHQENAAAGRREVLHARHWQPGVVEFRVESIVTITLKRAVT
jgi:hypothetical protein